MQTFSKRNLAFFSKDVYITRTTSCAKKGCAVYIFHIDMNFSAYRPAFLKELLQQAAHIGFDTVLWEIEDKVALDSLGSSVHPDAMSKAAFKELLAFARQLGLVSIPLFQTLGHGEYVLEKEAYFSLREQGTPDCYCVSNPDVRRFLSAAILEIADLFEDPPLFHLGGDEAYHFAICPQCAARGRNQLFCEHENALAALLTQRGIRPAIWHDMPCEHPEVLKELDSRFVIFLWNYDHFEEWPEEKVFAGTGFDMVICPSSGSCGDSPFMPVWDHHAGNIAGAAALAERLGARGLCMTSWSIRLGLKMIQRPFWELGALLKVHGKSFQDAEKEIIGKYFSFKDPESAGAWHLDLLPLSGVQWDLYKDGVMPPAGYLAEKLAADPAWGKRAAEESIRLLERLSLIQTDPADIWYEAVELKKRYLLCVHRLLTGGEVSDRELRCLERDFCSYLAKEQLPDSAEHNAQLVFEPLLEYLNSQ